MKYNYKKAYSNGEFITATKLSILENIKRQKRIINNSKKYNEEERELIMKGLDMAFDRAFAVHLEMDLL